MMTRSPHDAAESAAPRAARVARRVLCRVFAGSIGLVALLAATAAGAQTLSVDASSSPRGNPHFWSTCLGTGTASLTLRADLQTHYKLARRELGMLRIRGHGVLNDDMGIFKWAGGSATPTYDWTKYDKYLEAIAAADMRPIMELSFMPTDLARSGSDRDPASNLDVYRQLIQSVVQHTVDKYGAEDVGKWYWEVWNEPNYEGFWNGTMEDYFAMYDAAAEGATTALANILIGGPVTTQGSTSQMSAFLQHVKMSGSRVTFLSSHAYPGGAGDSASASFGVSDNNGRLQVITGAGFAKGELLSMNTEWNTAYTGQGGNMAANNVSMDSHVNAPFIVKSVKLLADQVEGDKPPLDVFAYWVVSDVFGEYGSDAGSYIATQGGGTLPFGQVFGLLTYQGVRKAAWNGFRMLNHLGTKRLAVTGGSGNADGVDAIATISASGDEVAIIVYNYHTAIATTGSDMVTVNVNNLPFAGKQIFVTKVGVDEGRSNPYGVWVEQGRPRAPTEEQWQAMRKAQHLELLEPVASVAGAATYSTSLTLPRQGAAMILLGPNRPVIGRDARVEIEGEDYDGQSGATREDSNDESLGQSIAGKGGSHVFFEQVDFSDAGVDSVQLRVNAQSATTLALHADAPDGPLLGTCAVAETAGSWASQKCALGKATGVHTLYAVFGGELRLNWMKFESVGGTSGSGGSGGMPPSTGGGAAGGAVPAGGSAGISNGGSSGAPVTGSGGAANPNGGSAPANGGALSGGRGGGAQAGGSAPTGAAATAGTGPASGTGGPSGDSGGCGCRVSSNRHSPLLPALVGLGWLFYRRRRRRR